MLETILLILIAFVIPIPMWLIILHSVSIKSKGIIRKIIYYSIGIFWLLSLILVFLNKDLILAQKFTPTLVGKIFGIILLFLAIIIDVNILKTLGFKRLICLIEIKGKSENQLITNGIYRYARHPRYIEYLFLSLFLGLFFGYKSFLYLSIYLFIAFYIVTYFEEKELIHRFKQQYLEYKKRVPGFFIKLK